MKTRPPAAVYARALCAPIIEPTVLDLQNPTPLETARPRQHRRHPIRARRQPDLPRALAPAHWQKSLWWQRATHAGETAPLVHVAAVWTWPMAVHDPIGIRHKLRNRIIGARALGSQWRPPSLISSPSGTRPTSRACCSTRPPAGSDPPLRRR